MLDNQPASKHPSDMILSSPRSRKSRLFFGAASAALLAVGTGCTQPAKADEAPKGQLNYQLTVQPESIQAKAGEKGTVKVVLKPTGTAHVDPRAPMALAVTTTGAVTADKASLGHADAKEQSDKSVEIPVAFTAKTPGSDTIKVHADFYLCTEKICERQVTDVTVPVTVN